jgi:hypothetical protein
MVPEDGMACFEARRDWVNGKRPVVTEDDDRGRALQAYGLPTLMGLHGESPLVSAAIHRVLAR